MMSLLDEEKLDAKQIENKLEVIQILKCFLKQSNIMGFSVSISDQEQLKEINDTKHFSWLGWTIANGPADDVASLIKSKLPDDPLLGLYNLCRNATRKRNIKN